MRSPAQSQGIAASPLKSVSMNRSDFRLLINESESVAPAFVGALELLEARHGDDVVAGIHVVDLAGDAARQVGKQIERRAADFLQRDRAPQRGSARSTRSMPLRNA